MGRTVRRTAPTSPTPTVESYAYTGTGETAWRIESTGGTDSVRSSLIDATGARLSFTGTGGALAWTVYDPLGSTAALVAGSGAGQLVDRYDS